MACTWANVAHSKPLVTLSSEQVHRGYEKWSIVAAVETTTLWRAITMSYGLAKPCQTIVVPNSVTPASLSLKWRDRATMKAHTSCKSLIARLQFSNSNQSYEPRSFLFLEVLRIFVCYPLNLSTTQCYILTVGLSQHTLAGRN